MHDVALGLSLVLVLGMVAQWLAWSLRLPSILLLLLFGFVAGRFVSPQAILGEELLFPVVSLAVATILLEGGLTLRFREIQDTRHALFRLCTLGTLIAWVLITVFGHYVIQLDWRLATLLGAILVVTGPTVIGPLLRQVKPVRSVGNIAKWEGIVVDPVGAILAVLVFQAVLAGGENGAAVSTIVALLKAILIGGLGGFVTGRLLIAAFSRHLLPDYLHSPVLLATALLACALSNRLQPEVGLLTVTVLGITLANQQAFSLTHIIEFKENLRTLLISGLFIVLSARIDLDSLQALGWRGPTFVALLILVVRPVSVLLSLAGSGLPLKHRFYLGCLAPRGIVAAAVISVFAVEIMQVADQEAMPHLAEQAQALTPIAFLVIAGTVTVYGLFSGPLARRLGLAIRNPQGILFAGADKWVIDAAKILRELKIEVLVVDTNPTHIAQARMAGLPALTANVLSNYVTEDLELFGIGRLLAVTRNFEVNTLACQEFIHHFGRENVYQLRFNQTPSQRKDVTQRMRGRPLFTERLTAEELDSWFVAGSSVKKTSLTEKFTVQDFRARYGNDAIPLFSFNGEKLTVLSGETANLPPGTTILFLIKAQAMEQAKAADLGSVKAEGREAAETSSLQ